MFNRIRQLAFLVGILALPLGLGACGGSHSSGLQLSAGADQTVLGSPKVILFASSKADKQRYHWTLESKPAASRLTETDIGGADSATASFTPDVAGVYVLKLSLHGNRGTATDTVRVTSRLAITAGADRTVEGGEPVALHAGSNAVKPSYRWSFVSRPDGSRAALADADTPSARFTPDAGGVYVARVSLADGKASDTVSITAEHVWQSGIVPKATAAMADAVSLAVAPDGSLYVAYSDEDEGDKAVVKKFDGREWKKLGDAPVSAGDARFVSLAVSPQGTPYVAYQDFGVQGRGGVTVREFAGGKWATVGRAGFSAGEAEYIALAIAADGTPWVAYQEFSNEARGGLTVRKFDHGQWIAAGRAGFSAGGARYISLAIAPDGTPWVAYQDIADIHHGVTVAAFDGKRWNAVGNPGFTPGGAVFVSLALASESSPYVIYEDGGPEHPASVQKFDGKHWAYAGEAWFTRGEAEFDTIAFTRKGTAYVAYQDEINDGISVRKFDGKQWQFVGRPGFSDGEAEGISLAIAHDGRLYVAYRSDAQDVGGEDKLSVKTFNGKHWVPVGDAQGSSDDKD